MWESPEGLNVNGFESSTDSFAHFKNKTWNMKREYQVRLIYQINELSVVMNNVIFCYMAHLSNYSYIFTLFSDHCVSMLG